MAGRRSDRTGRRKVFVIWSGAVMAVAAVLLAAWPTWTGAMVAAAVSGAGYGVYIAVDAALITQVLPAAADRAKDLGVINIANSAPQVLGPAISAPIMVSLGGYPVLYALTAVVTLAGSVLVTRISRSPSAPRRPRRQSTGPGAIGPSGAFARADGDQRVGAAGGVRGGRCCGGVSRSAWVTGSGPHRSSVALRRGGRLVRDGASLDPVLPRDDEVRHTVARVQLLAGVGHLDDVPGGGAGRRSSRCRSAPR